ncbi:MAG: DUF5915 domain-containing protein, partial [Chitinophagaceae bacterium]
STLYNTYNFFALYANLDGFVYDQEEIPLNQRPEIDRWILSALHSLVAVVTESMDDYEPTRAGRAIQEFVDQQLSNWYVRLCRRRFWKGEYETDKISAYQTLYTCLEHISRLMAPIAPFFADWLFGNLNRVTGKDPSDSVHLSWFPPSLGTFRDPSLEERMTLAQEISSMALSLRKKVNIKVRQPLGVLLIPILDVSMQDHLERVAQLIKNEVNIKEIKYLKSSDDFIKKRIKPNFKALGSRMGSKMKAAALAISAFTPADISRLEKEGEYSLLLDQETISIKLDEVEIYSEDIPGWVVTSKGPLTVALDIHLTPELLAEGYARELVNRIQKIRKESGFSLTDRISVTLSENALLKSAIIQFNDYICTEILADSLEIVPQMQNGIEIEVGDIPIYILIHQKH